MCLIIKFQKKEGRERIYLNIIKTKTCNVIDNTTPRKSGQHFLQNTELCKYLLDKILSYFVFQKKSILFYTPMNFQRKNIEKYVQSTASSKSKMPQNKPNEGGKEKVL